MIVAVSFWIFLLSALLVFFIFGEKSERLFAILIILATITTYLSNNHYGLGNINYIVISIDALLFIVALFMVIKSDQYWPIWFCGFHFNTVATNAASIAFPNAVPSLFLNLAGAWALPALGIGAYGVWLDYRSKSKRNIRRPLE